MKTSTQLKAKLRNVAAAKGVEAEVILRTYMLERFLERVSNSQYRDNFILKGGMLIAAIVGIAERTTMDMDASYRGHRLTELQVLSIIKEIVAIALDDDVHFEVIGVEEIRQGELYPSFRVTMNALLDKTRQVVKIDLTSSEQPIQSAIDFEYPLLLEDETISIAAYNIETILAEKFETIITRGISNTRMRDFYDVLILTTAHNDLIDYPLFVSSLESTARSRETLGEVANREKVIDAISNDVGMAEHWRRYQNRYGYASSVTWEQAQRAVARLAAHYTPDSI